MHWIEKWRKDHQMDRFQFAKAVGVSESLIWLLENERNAITHPMIANDIADYTGATIAQRDSIVHEKHKGTWRPDPKKRRRNKKAAKSETKPDTKPAAMCNDGRFKGREVYAIDKDGEIVGRYISVSDAARQNAMETSTVYARCQETLVENEFLANDITFRFADGYDEAARAVIAALGAEAREKQKSGMWRYNSGWFLRINGESRPLREWAAMSGIKAFTLLDRIQRGIPPEEAIKYKDMRGRTKNGNRNA